ncbi:MAG: Gfo/Idh/MocA family oxidoreductase [Candidatus Nealsonbacteria bacterium]|nr:Gfo/Idh/MocA family oxidoreductase [Candidatus Nealsonbacteria bacterium]
MSETKSTTSRRDFLKNTGRVAAASALMAGATPRVHAAENNTIQVALVGCGGRGTGAAMNALSVNNGPIKLVALADVFESRVTARYKALKGRFADKVDVPEERQFVGFDAYKKALDCLNPGDIAIFATPPAFRWVHFGYAVEKGLNVFMEKPVTVDGPTTRRMIALAAEADKKKLKVGVGLMVRHCHGRKELRERIADGQIGEIIAMRGYRMGGRAAAAGPKPEGISELLYQIQKFHSFIWASGGVYSDFYIHQIDECSWMKGAWPVEAHALGGRHYRGDAVDQNLDTYSIEYVYPDGTRFFYYGRNMSGCEGGFSSYAHGTKGSAIISTSSHHPGKVRIFKGHNFAKEDCVWGPPTEPNPYQLEWDDLIDAIRQDKPYNEAKRGAEASMVSSMGRMAAHTGRPITFDEMLNHEHELAPGLDLVTDDSPAPIQLQADGMYPVPMPGLQTKREY